MWHFSGNPLEFIWIVMGNYEEIVGNYMEIVGFVFNLVNIIGNCVVI